MNASCVVWQTSSLRSQVLVGGDKGLPIGWMQSVSNCVVSLAGSRRFTAEHSRPPIVWLGFSMSVSVTRFTARRSMHTGTYVFQKMHHLPKKLWITLWWGSRNLDKRRSLLCLLSCMLTARLRTMRQKKWDDWRPALRSSSNGWRQIDWSWTLIRLSLSGSVHGSNLQMSLRRRSLWRTTASQHCAASRVLALTSTMSWRLRRTWSGFQPAASISSASCGLFGQHFLLIMSRCLSTLLFASRVDYCNSIL